MIIFGIFVILIIISIWISRPLRAKEPGFEFVYVNQDGSVRELSPGESAYLGEDFSGADGGRPYIKNSYRSKDGWGSQSGFIERRCIPTRISILQVHPDYDARENEIEYDPLGSDRAAGDIIKKCPDGSIMCSPNPNISRSRRFELARQYVLEDQRRRELLARNE